MSVGADPAMAGGDAARGPVSRYRARCSLNFVPSLQRSPPDLYRLVVRPICRRFLAGVRVDMFPPLPLIPTVLAPATPR